MRRSVSLFIIAFISILVFGQNSIVAQGTGPTRTYLPSLTVPVCTASPLQVNALDVVLKSSEIPSKYFLEYQKTYVWESTNRLQSDVRTDFDYGDPEVGPTYLTDEVGVYCNEQIPVDFWPTAKARMRAKIPAVSEEPKLEIGDETYVAVYRYHYAVYYEVVFREKNVMVFMDIGGRNGVLDLDIVENLADTIDAKLEPSTSYISSN